MILCARKTVQRFSCTAPGMERLFLDHLRAVKKVFALEVGCGGVGNSGVFNFVI